MAIPTPITLDSDEPKVQKDYNFDHGKVIDLTEEAIQYVKDFAEQNADKISGKLFKIGVEGGGCSGMQYVFTFEEPSKEEHHIVSCGDIQILVDKTAEEFLKSSVVDFEKSMTGTGLVVKNPQAKAECGCGISFAV